MNVAERLKIVMDHYDMTPSSLADLLEVQRSSISHLLSGRNNPSLDFVMKVLENFPEVDLYWFVNGVGEFPLKEKNENLNSNTLFSAIEENDSTSETETSKNDISVPFEKALTKTNNSTKLIEQIVVFYNDKTFTNYIPND